MTGAQVPPRHPDGQRRCKVVGNARKCSALELLLSEQSLQKPLVDLSRFSCDLPDPRSGYHCR